MRLLLFFCFVFGLCSMSGAQGAETVIKEILTNSDSRQMAHKKVLNELSRELVREAIGTDRYQAELKRIEKYIIKNQNRYILSTRSSSPVLQDGGKFSFTVTVRVSKENLKNLLLEHNLFYASEGSSCLLPVVSFSSHWTETKKNYSWWLKDQDEPEKQLKQTAGSFFRLLSEELIKTGFYGLNPVFQRMGEGTPPPVLPKKSRQARNFVPLAEFYSCDIILLGYVQMGRLSSRSSLTGLFSFSKSADEAVPVHQNWIQFSFNVFNIKIRQFLFRLKKKFPLSPAGQKDPQIEVLSRSKDILDSVTYQLSAYQEEGSLDLNRLLLSVQGPLSYAEKEQLKKSLIEKIQGIQNLEERLLTAGRVVYLAESSDSAGTIARQIRRASLPPFVIQVKGHKNRELEIYAKKKNF